MRRIPAAALVLLLFAPTVGAHPSRLAGGRLASDIETWRGLMVFAEYRCSPYDRQADYPYSQSLEPKIAANLGGWWSPYDGTPFPNEESDIEHVVAVSESHGSGLCVADAETRRRFASGPGQLDARAAGVESVRDGGARRGRLASRAESVLVCRTRAGSETGVPAICRSAGGRRPGGDAGRVPHRGRPTALPTATSGDNRMTTTVAWCVTIPRKGRGGLAAGAQSVLWLRRRLAARPNNWR